MPENFEGRENEQEEIEPVIEYAQKGDCSAIAEVDRDRMLQRLEEHGCPLREFNKEERVEQLEKEIADPNKRYLVLKIEGQTAGYIELVNNTEWVKKFKCKRNTVFASTISVIRPYQGQGNGPKLVERAIENAKDLFGAKYMRANVIMENEPAVKMWQNVGFKQVTDPQPTGGTWDGKPSHTIMMEKVLE